MSELPSGWEQVNLSDIAHVESGIGFPLNYQGEKTGDLGFFKVGDISRAVAQFSGQLKNAQHYVSYAVASELKGKPVLAGATVFAKIGEAIRLHRRAYVVEDCLIDNNVMAVKAFDSRSDRYLFRFMQSQDVSELARSTTVPSLRKGDIEGLHVPLAPLNEQIRIADKLDAVLTRVDACRDRLDRIPSILKRFRQSVLAAATSGKLTEEWRASNTQPDIASIIGSLSATQKARRGVTDDVASASDYVDSWDYPKKWWKGTAASLLCKGVFIDLKDGNHGANHPVVSDFTNVGLPFITAAQVEKFVVDYDGAYKITGAPLQKLRVGFAKSGDVVLTHKGSVGRVGIIDRDCVLTPQTTYYRLNSQFVLPKFLMYFMASQPFSGQLDEIKSQTTRDFVPITLQYALVHLLPPIDEQNEIVRRVDILFAFADRLEARHTAARAQVEKLTPATLAKAFRGELVPQDPNDEPASVLLERIKSASVDGAIKPLSKRTSKKPKPEQATKVALISLAKAKDDTMKKYSLTKLEDIAPNHLANILNIIKQQDAKAIWSSSGLSIDDFYVQLNREISTGLLRVSKDDESRLELVSVGKAKG